MEGDEMKMEADEMEINFFFASFQVGDVFKVNFFLIVGEHGEQGVRAISKSGRHSHVIMLSQTQSRELNGGHLAKYAM